MSAAKPVVVYLLWAPLGAGRIETFLEAYQAHRSGHDHELVVAACGASGQAPLEPLLKLFEPFEHTVEHFEGPRQDLMTYREVVDRRLEAEEFVFMNSYARPLADDWLHMMLECLRLPGVGIVGPNGSWESPSGWKRSGWKASYLFFFFPIFPNPHIRTSVFAMRREGVEAIRWPRRITNKRMAWALEHSRWSFTHQLQRKGMRPLVVGRDGKRYEIDQWEASGTFRHGDQENLLIADLRTDDYEEAGQEHRDWLKWIAWHDRQT